MQTKSLRRNRVVFNYFQERTDRSVRPFRFCRRESPYCSDRVLTVEGPSAVGTPRLQRSRICIIDVAAPQLALIGSVFSVVVAIYSKKLESCKFVVSWAELFGENDLLRSARSLK
jgi:hypothetical protein